MNKAKMIFIIGFLTVSLLNVEGCSKKNFPAFDTMSPVKEQDHSENEADISDVTSLTITEAPVSVTKAPSLTEVPVPVTKAPSPTEVPVTVTKAPTPTNVPVLEKTVDRASSCSYMIWDKAPEAADVYFRAKDHSNIFYEYGGDFWDFWKFSDKGIVGIGKDYINGISVINEHENTENNAYSEMYAGFRASIKNGRYLKIEHYYNSHDISCKNIKIMFMDGSIPDYDIDPDKNVTADMSDASYCNGFYDIKAEYESGGHTFGAHLYMFVNCPSNDEADFRAYICCGRSAYRTRWDEDGCMTRQAKIRDMIEAKGITAENSLDYNISYPYEAKGQAEYNGCSTYVEDTGFWLNMADKILSGHENDSAAFKALLLHDWMTENLIYDSYKVNYLENPRYYGHYDTGLYYVSDCKVGVCRDYVNIYAIMCRKYGVPCIILGNTAKGHVWNAVYLDGEWVEVDLTGDIGRYANTSDVTNVTEATVDNTHCYKNFCNYRDNEIMPVASEVNSWLHMI